VLAVKMVSCITRPAKLEAIMDALTGAGVLGMTVTAVRGYGKQGGVIGHLRGSEYHIRLLDKVRVEIALPDDRVDEVVTLLLATARTGEIGDGKVFVMPLDGAWRIRTGESGEDVL
jgi:nitrogen regulatory protein PII